MTQDIHTFPIRARYLQRNDRLVLFNRNGRNKVSKLRRVHINDDHVRVWGPGIPTTGHAVPLDAEVMAERRI